MLTFFVNFGRNGFYIAAQDQGACMSILSLRVYYFYCPKVVKGLATFSRTVSGNGTASLDYVEGVCVPNANITTPYGKKPFNSKQDYSSAGLILKRAFSISRPIEYLC